MVRKRLLWVDLAKAFVIISMIVGHVVPYKSTMYVMIFSFHMPFFFMISGYTSHKVKDELEWKRYTLNTFRRILTPTLIVAYIAALETVSKWNMYSFFSSLKQGTIELIWGGTPPSKYHMGVSLIWFLISFCIAKLIYEYLSLLLTNKQMIILLTLVSFLFYEFISRHFYLPFVLDLVPLATLYMCFGREIRDNEHLVSHFELLIFAICFSYWAYMVETGVFIDMSNRLFGMWPITLCEAIGGSIVIIFVSKIIAEVKIPLVSYFAKIGQHTLMIMCVHQVDLFAKWAPFANAYLNALVRVLFDITIAMMCSYAIRKAWPKFKTSEN